jgi:DNA repair exonuclease
MRIAFVSDLHAEFREFTVEAPPGYVAVWGGVHFPENVDADCLVVAGDIHPNPKVRSEIEQALERLYGLPVITVKGNHDYWGASFPISETGTIHEIGGVRIAAATLWTHLSPVDEMRALTFCDFKLIRELTPAIWNCVHRNQLEFLQKSEADVIVTHHAPSYMSVADRFRDSPVNSFFVNDLDFGRFMNCRVWIHGHVHVEFDYVQDSIRIMCNPIGYPFERNGPIKLRYVEV